MTHLPTARAALSGLRRGAGTPRLRAPLGALAALAIAGCASAGAPETAGAPTPRPGAQAAEKSPETAAAQTAPEPAPRPMTPAEIDAGFAAWKADFRARALAKGVSATLFDRAFAGVRPNPEVMRLDNYQAEFVRPIWAYLDSAVSDSRVENGRAAFGERAPLFAALEERHGVDGEVIAAIWGVETAYGAVRGDINTIEALATLAYDGRRRGFAEDQLFAAFDILKKGEVAPEDMRGSWAGAMGHTQFIPTSYQLYAVDHDGDGRSNIWAEDPADALASTGAYLARFGWERGAPWGVEVRLPAGFDLSLADQAIRRDPSAWRAMGVTAADGSPLPDHGEASVILPAGAAGPAFAVFKNFRVIKRYNNATSYAMAVGLLAERIGGAPAHGFAWPRDQRRMAVEEMKEVQALLNGLGYGAGVPDGIIGPNTQNAVRAFQRASGMAPDGHVNAPLLDALRAAAGG